MLTEKPAGLPATDVVAKMATAPGESRTHVCHPMFPAPGSRPIVGAPISRPTPRHAARCCLGLLLATTVALSACQRDSAPSTAETAREPAKAVLQLADDLHRNDLVGYAQHALPPELHARMATAWRDGRTIWPLTELPLDDRLPSFITMLAAPNAEKKLLAAYNRQFAGADRQLRSAAATLGLFATQYVKSAPDYRDAQRQHYVQLIGALSGWGRQAALGDPAKARVAIPRLVAAARLTGLAGPGPNERAATFHRLGMQRSLQRLGPFMARFKQVLAGYGLDLDAALASVQADTVEQTGDRAKVRLRYTLAGKPVDTVVPLERHDGRWYLSGLLRHARVEAGETGENDKNDKNDENSVDSTAVVSP